jgi:hypothetical protein
MTTVALHHGDQLMHRLATETLRLRIHRDAIDALIADHTDQLLAGLHERSSKAGDCPRLELDGLIIRRNGPTGIDILTTGRTR